MVAFAYVSRRTAVALTSIVTTILSVSVYLQLSLIVYRVDSNILEAKLQLPDQLPFEIQRLKEVASASQDSEKPQSPNDDPEKKMATVAGQQPNTRPTEEEDSKSKFVVDILSIGSEYALDLLKTQRNSFASHITVRNFFNATELDDIDRSCHSDLTKEDAYAIAGQCRGGKKEIKVGAESISHELHRQALCLARIVEEETQPSGMVVRATAIYTWFAQGSSKLQTHRPKLS
jgi:hypothetical protein